MACSVDFTSTAISWSPKIKSTSNPEDVRHKSCWEDNLMTKDPVVEEIRKNRQERAAQFDFDLSAITDDAKKRQKKSKHPVV